jgi:hypothetical protein
MTGQSLYVPKEFPRTLLSGNILESNELGTTSTSHFLMLLSNEAENKMPFEYANPPMLLVCPKSCAQLGVEGYAMCELKLAKILACV